MIERAASLIYRRLSSAGSILCFHDVAAAGLRSANDVHVPFEHFSQILDAVRDAGELVALSELVERHLARRSTAGLVALTFDDAYAGLVSIVDLVEHQSVPVSIFAVSSAARDGDRFWWDRVDTVHRRTSPERWRTFEDELGLPEDYRRGQPPSLGALRPLRQWVLSKHLGRWPNELEPTLARLEHETGAYCSERSMTFEELAAFAARGPVEIGVHTRSHPVLPFLEDEKLNQEVDGCYRDLRDRFENVIPVLAIPFGLCDERTIRLARGAGMTASLTLAPETLSRSAGKDWLPRFCMSASEPTWKLRIRLSGAAEPWQRLIGRALAYPDLPSATT